MQQQKGKNVPILTDNQKATIECVDSWCRTYGLPTYSELHQQLTCIRLNAKLVPDPAMQGATDCYTVPLDDIEAITL